MPFGDRLRAAGSALLGRDMPQAGGADLRSVRAEGSVVFTGLDDPRLADYVRGGGNMTRSGAVINDQTALMQGVSFRCASVICGSLMQMPCDLMLRESETSRKPADDPFREVLTVRPNHWQTPGEFKKMLQLHKLQRGNGYAMKIVSRGRIIALWPLDPNRMTGPVQNADMSLTYRYTRLDGRTVEFSQDEIMHLRGLSWDGLTGLPVVRYMAESLGIATQTQKATATLFKNGQFRPGYLQTDKPLSDTAYNRLKKSIDDNAGVDANDAFKMEILEEGLKYEAGGVSAQDAQLAQIMGFTRSDIGMFYGVPPHLYGDTDKSTSWGTGIEQQNIGFLQYTMGDHLQTWVETLKRDCLSVKGMDPRLYVKFDLKGFLAADSATRSAYLSRALGAGGAPPWMTQNEVRAVEDLSPSKEPFADLLPQFGTGKEPIKETGNGQTAKP